MPKHTQAELLISVDLESETPLYEQLYLSLRRAIETGALEAGEKLPSIRSVCDSQGISHTTVEHTYQQLCVEGYVDSVPKSGFRVRKLDTGFFLGKRAQAASPSPKRLPDPPSNPLRDQSVAGRTARYDFSFTDMQPGSFSVKDWRRAMDEVLYSPDVAMMCRYPHEESAPELASQLASYLHKHRGVQCEPEQIILQPGTERALSATLSLFDPAECVVAVEEPGYAGIRRAAANLGFDVVAIPTDRGGDAFIEALRRSGAKIAFTTPSHQFPTGSVLPLPHRIELLKWAAENDAFIIEDDSCNEYRYETHPIPSLQSLDREDRVVYVGNFSKVLSPSMRMAYMVLTPELLGRRYARKGTQIQSVPWVTQATLAKFFEMGYWDHHVRKTVAGNQARHNELLACLTREMGDGLTIGGIDSGIHFYVTVHNGMTADELMASALEQDANVYGVSQYWFTREPDEGTVIIGFSSIRLEDIAPGVSALKKAWFA